MSSGINMYRRWYSLAVLVLLTTLSVRVMAETILVDESCSLFDAITAANADSASNGCPAGSGADTISLPAASTITITGPVTNRFGQVLPYGLPAITSAITIEGNGSAIERDDAPETQVFRIFEVHSTAVMSLKNLTVRNGLSGTNSSGGGIANRGSLTLFNVTVSENNADSENNTGGGAGGINNNTNGVLIIIDSTIRDNTAKHGGGGIVNRGVLTIENSVISGNKSVNGGGGGILSFFGKTATIFATTIEDNTSASGGAGLQSLGTTRVTQSVFRGNHSETIGGGIHSQDSLTISNSTLSGNTADISGGGLTGQDIVTLINTTVTNNTGGGISRAGAIPPVFNNTIIANNEAADCSNIPDYVDTGNNWFSDTSCNGTADGDPQLGPLADNGGPTWTHALLDGSGAINAGDIAICSADPVDSKDQRGNPRPEPDGSQCDIGAFELQDAAPPPEDVFEDSFE